MATRKPSWRSVRSAALLGLAAPLAFVGAAQAQEEPPFPDSPCESSAECGSFQGCLDGTCVALTPTDTPCVEEIDCPEAGSVCVDGLCWAPEGGGTGVDPQPAQICESDAECPEGELCLEGYCAGDYIPPDVGQCEADADCGEGNICVACFCMPAEGTCRADADCPAGQRCDTVSVGSAGGSTGPGDEPGPVCEGTYGYCGIDYTQVEADPRCNTFCELMVTCGGSDEPVSSDDEDTESGGEATDFAEQGLSGDTEECIGFCSYLLTDGDAGDEMTALVDCVAANAEAGCDAIGSACGGQAEAVGEAASDVPAGVIGADEAGGGGSGGATGAPRESGTLGDVFGHAFGDDSNNGPGDADAGANGGGNGTTDDGGSASGCTVSRVPTPGVLGLFLLALGGLGLARRRR